MFHRTNRWIPVGILTAWCLFWSAGLAALTFNVVLNSNSASLSGANAILAFDFISPLDSLSNSGELSPITTNGALGAATIVPGSDITDASGVGTGPWIFSDAGDTSFFNELLIDFTFNAGVTSLSFSFTPLTNNPPLGGTPDSFAFFLLDSSGFPIETTDPSGALFLFNFGQGEQSLSVFPPLDTGISLEVTSSQDGGAPEPGTLALLVVGFAALLQRRRFM